MEYQIEVVEIEPQDTAVFCGHAKVEGMGDFLGLAFRQVMGALGVQEVTGPPFARYDMAEDGFAVEAGFPVAVPFAGTGQVEGSTLPGGTAARTMHVGSYQGLGSAYSALEEWLRANRYETSGAPWETYLDDPEVAEPRTLVFWPCAAV
jgi:effector-binding domain-containing protein